MKINIVLLTLITLMPVSLFSKKVINSGHQSSVKIINYNKLNDSFFSISEDGTLVIKKRNSDSISQRIFLSSHSITSFSLSPKNTHLAIVETDNASVFMVTVWDWKRERKLYSIKLDEFPMSVGFTGNGSYIYTTSISSNPVKVYNARSGATTTYLNKNNKFIDYIYIGASEKYAFLYSSTGTLDIWLLKEGKLYRSLKTKSNLTNLTVSPDKKFIVGQDDNSIYVIGRNNGKISDKIEIDNLETYKLNETTSELNLFINGKYKKSIKTLPLVGGKIMETDTNEVILKKSISQLEAAYNTVLYSDDSGNIYSYNKWEKTKDVFVDNSITNIENIVIVDDKAVIISDNKIYSFISPFFVDRIKNPQRLTQFSLTHSDSPIDNPIGIMEYNNNLLIWKDSVVLYDLNNQELLFEHKMTSDIMDLKIQEGKLLLLDQNGYIEIIDLVNYKSTYRVKTPGFTSISFYTEKELIGGIDSSYGSSLMIFDLNTKETIPVKISLDIVLNIKNSNTSYIFYIAGLKKDSNETRFIEYNMLTKKERILSKTQGENINSNYFFNGDKTLFTNLGISSLLKIDTKSYRVKPFKDTINRTKKIYFKSNGLYTINENKSLSIWHPITGRKLMDFYLFKNDQWVAIIQNGNRAFGSPGSEKFIANN